MMNRPKAAIAGIITRRTPNRSINRPYNGAVGAAVHDITGMIIEKVALDHPVSCATAVIRRLNPATIIGPGPSSVPVIVATNAPIDPAFNSPGACWEIGKACTE